MGRHSAESQYGGLTKQTGEDVLNREDKYLFDSALRNQKKKQKTEEISIDEQIQNLLITGVVVHAVCQIAQELKEEKAKKESK